MKLQTTDLLLIQCCYSNKRIKVLKENKNIEKKEAIFGKRNRAACGTKKKTTQNNIHKKHNTRTNYITINIFAHLSIILDNQQTPSEKKEKKTTNNNKKNMKKESKLKA